MARTVAELEANAEKFWPKKLTGQEFKSSIIPTLIDTQEKFIGLLYVASVEPDSWVRVLSEIEGMTPSLFLKHLIVLSNVGGEKLQRVRRSLDTIFPDGQMQYRWKAKDCTYSFLSLGEGRRWGNKELGVSGAGLLRGGDLRPVQQDVAMLLLHGGTSIDPQVPEYILENCVLGSLLGNKLALDAFVRQRYIHVSRITGGATANAMGQLCQNYVRERLQSALPLWKFTRKTIPGISQNEGRTDISFDIVAESPSRRSCAIEVSFQVTTNSTIERKAGQAQSRQAVLRQNGHKIAYVIDGAGNFERQSALSTICNFSDCTVTFKDEELDTLAAFLQSLEGTTPALP